MRRSPALPPNGLAAACTTALAIALAIASASTGCHRPNDRPKMEAEIQAIAEAGAARLSDLTDRADAAERARNRLPRALPGAAAAEHRLAQARAAIAEQRGTLATVAPRLRAIPPGSQAPIRALIDELRGRLANGATLAIGDLEAVESWIASAERQPRDAAATAEPGAPGTGESQPPTGEQPPGGDRAPETDRSGDPIR